MKLSPEVLTRCIESLPQEVVTVMQRHGTDAMLAGGYIRAIVAGEKPSDIDLFVPSEEAAKAIAASFLEVMQGSTSSRTDNAITIRRESGVPVQIIHRWKFETPLEVITSFDFTISMAVVWWDKREPALWCSECDPLFESDVRNKILYYCNPVRQEAKAGSLLRVFKFYKRGYSIDPDNAARVMARVFTGVDLFDGKVSEGSVATQLVGLLGKAGHRIPAPPKMDGGFTPDNIGAVSACFGGCSG